MRPHDDDTPLEELKHAAVPGYLTAFVIAFAVLSLYLAIILISSPGSAKEGGFKKAGDHTKLES